MNSRDSAYTFLRQLQESATGQVQAIEALQGEITLDHPVTWTSGLGAAFAMDPTEIEDKIVIRTTFQDGRIAEKVVDIADLAELTSDVIIDEVTGMHLDEVVNDLNASLQANLAVEDIVQQVIDDVNVNQQVLLTKVLQNTTIDDQTKDMLTSVLSHSSIDGGKVDFKTFFKGLGSYVDAMKDTADGGSWTLDTSTPFYNQNFMNTIKDGLITGVVAIVEMVAWTVSKVAGCIVSIVKTVFDAFKSIEPLGDFKIDDRATELIIKGSFGSFSQSYASADPTAPTLLERRYGGLFAKEFVSEGGNLIFRKYAWRDATTKTFNFNEYLSCDFDLNKFFDWMGDNGYFPVSSRIELRDQVMDHCKVVIPIGFDLALRNYLLDVDNYKAFDIDADTEEQLIQGALPIENRFYMNLIAGLGLSSLPIGEELIYANTTLPIAPSGEHDHFYMPTLNETEVPAELWSSYDENEYPYATYAIDRAACWTVLLQMMTYRLYGSGENIHLLPLDSRPDVYNNYVNRDEDITTAKKLYEHRLRAMYTLDPHTSWNSNYFEPYYLDSGNSSSTGNTTFNFTRTMIMGNAVTRSMTYDSSAVDPTVGSHRVALPDVYMITGSSFAIGDLSPVGSMAPFSPKRRYVIPTGTVDLPSISTGYIIRTLLIQAAVVAVTFVALKFAASRVKQNMAAKKALKISRLQTLRTNYINNPNDKNARKQFVKGVRKYNWSAGLTGAPLFNAGTGMLASTPALIQSPSSDSGAFDDILDNLVDQDELKQAALDKLGIDTEDIGNTLSDIESTVPVQLSDLKTLITGNS